jgi:hypothetical protein
VIDNFSTLRPHMFFLKNLCARLLDEELINNLTMNLPRVSCCEVNLCAGFPWMKSHKCPLISVNFGKYHIITFISVSGSQMQLFHEKASDEKSLRNCPFNLS